MTFLQFGQNQSVFESHNQDFQEETEFSSVFICESPVMKVIYKKIKNMAFVSDPILILGEKGTGRRRAAYEIFCQSQNKLLENFIEFVCPGMSALEMDKKLFYEPGFLSCGADKTLFIKGLECWDKALQDKFLSYIVNHKSGGLGPRLIFSAEEGLTGKVKEGRFSQELFELLSQNLFILPPLSERIEDIPKLALLFNRQNGFKGCFSEEAEQALKSHLWRENITELKELCLKISLLPADTKHILKEDLPLKKDIVQYNPNMSLEELINLYISLSLDHFKSKKESAKALGISVKTIYNKIKSGCVIYSE